MKIPAPVDNLVGRNVMVMELMDGRPLATCVKVERAAIAEVMGVDVRDRVANGRERLARSRGSREVSPHSQRVFT